MDAVGHGQFFTVTRDGHGIAELIPLRRRRRFISRQEFAAMSRNCFRYRYRDFGGGREASRRPLWVTWLLDRGAAGRRRREAASSFAADRRPAQARVVLCQPRLRHIS
jgi:antitoxin (DNA-binding transcriptional repressor) of toxin-antitoxin stability system